MNKLDKDYQSILQDILENGTKKNDRTETGTLSVFGRQIRHNMSDGFPILTTKKMYTKGIVVELLWFLKGDTNIKYLVDNNCNIWNGDAYNKYESEKMLQRIQSYHPHFTNGDAGVEPPKFIETLSKEEFIEKIKTDDAFAKKWGELGPIYGKQWRNWSKITNDELGPNYENKIEYIDQIQNLINDLKNNPDSRRLMVTAWNPSDLPKQTLPPCHHGFQCYTRELKPRQRTEVAKKMGIHLSSDVKSSKEWSKECDENKVPKRALSLKWQQRSCDFPLGIPYNIASYGFLLEILAKKANMFPDELIGDLGDCHIYLNQIEGVKEQLNRSSYKLPKIKLSNDFDWLNYDLDTMIEWMLQNTNDWFEITDYNTHPIIKFPLSN